MTQNYVSKFLVNRKFTVTIIIYFYFKYQCVRQNTDTQMPINITLFAALFTMYIWAII